MALKTARIYFSNLKQKVESGFGLHDNGFFDNLLLNIFLATILIGLSMDR